MKRAVLTLAGCFALSASVACGGATPEPENPVTSEDPSLEDEPGGVQEASSPEVQKGIDAIQAEDFETAKEVLEAAVAKSPEDPQAVFYLGVAQAALGETDAALAQMHRALELKKDFTEASINYSALLLDAGRAEEALAAAQQGLEHKKDDGALLQNQGLALFDLQKYDEAAAALAHASKLAPDNQELRFVYAQSLLESGAEKEGLEQLDQLTDSTSVPVLASVADMYGRSKAWDKCISTLDSAIEKQAAAELLVKRGLCKHGLKDEDGAKQDFEKAIETDPNSAKGYFYLGQNLKERGDKKGAKQAFGKVVELDPEGQMGAAAKRAIQ